MQSDHLGNNTSEYGDNGVAKCGVGEQVGEKVLAEASRVMLADSPTLEGTASRS